MNKTKHTEISSLGEFGLIERVTAPFKSSNKSTVKGVGDDAAVIDTGDSYTLISTDLMSEGVDFDLTYFPLQHLGYKSVVVGISDILAMNGMPEQVTISLAISSKFSVEMIEQFYKGVEIACQEYGVDLVGGDTAPSVNGLIISVSAIGSVAKDKIAYRSGAKENDLICVTGDLGGAYMGMHLLEREKRAFDGHPNPTPKFEGYEYILQRQLRPSARPDIIETLATNGTTPTSMIDISDGLSSELLHICKESECGARIYLNRLPIAKQTYAMAEELNIDPVVAAINGGDEYELLFTAPLSAQDALFAMGVDVIGHITSQESGVMLVTPDDQEVRITAQGWK